ncbi:hypothetical protein FRC01_000999 [Tulasnella sp. 417]|nr:hypothetical protein FRC01_000999 [Tulasnella sp. 417]
MSSLARPGTRTIDHTVFRRPRAFEVREILDIIISFLDDKDLLTAVLVCKAWGPTALDHLWRTLGSVIPLFRLLGHMVLRADGWVSKDLYFMFYRLDRLK